MGDGGGRGNKLQEVVWGAYSLAASVERIAGQGLECREEAARRPSQ